MFRSLHARQRRGVLTRVGLLLALLGVAAVGLMSGQAADHRDGPIFVNTPVAGRADINDVYIFQSPLNNNNTVLGLTVSPFAGSVGGTPTTFDSSLIFDYNVHNVFNADGTVGDPNLTFRFTFSAPDANGRQQVTVRGLPATAFPNGGLLAKGLTSVAQSGAAPIMMRLPGFGTGQLFAGLCDDPFFFDATGFAQLLNGQLSPGTTYPRPRPADPNNPGPGQARNFFARSNLLAVVMEVPTAMLRNGANPMIGVWCRCEQNGKQVDRMGRPAINTALIPPVPRGSNIPNPAPDRRNEFNAALPKNDRTAFKASMVGIIQNVYGRDAATADALSNVLLPDILTVNTSLPFNDPNNGLKLDFTGPNGTPRVTLNGRRFRDNVIHAELFVLTNALTTDNVDDDNAQIIKDGTNGTTAVFPYIGAPNANPPSPPIGL
jgi:Domain of unknown function (DUF4331)